LKIFYNIFRRLVGIASHMLIAPIALLIWFALGIDAMNKFTEEAIFNSKFARWTRLFPGDDED
jgi:hypothetical protein